MSNNPVFRLLVTVLIMLPIISSCGPVTKKEPAAETEQQLAEARQNMDNGNYLAAAEIYQSLAGKSGKDKAISYIFMAVEAFIAGSDYTRAENLLTQLEDSEPAPLQIVKSGILSARIALARNDADTALSTLDFKLPDDTPGEFLADYYQTRAEAHALNNQHIPALRDRDRLSQLLDSVTAVNDNNNAMWSLLNELSTETLTNVSYTGETGPRLAGWYDLALIRKTQIYDQTALQKALDNWQQQYPGHPAAGTITADILQLAENANTRTNQIALLLPFNDAYRDAANAIREGFLSAWFESSGEKPDVKVYDSTQSAVSEVYQTAVNDGADVIVGPLQKDAVAELIVGADVQITTLALNQLQVTGTDSGGTDPVIPDKFFQFGLLPEAEAVQAAERAWSEGNANALVVTSANSWGDRIYEAFIRRWQELGGKITEHVQIPATIDDYSVPVKQLLNVDKSEERTKRLVATLSRNIESEPRYRRDADMIFLAVTPDMARQLVPQFRFYRAADIPAYSISAIYSGAFDPRSNADLDPVMFTDMPWMLETENEYSPLQQTLNRAWNQAESGYRRLYALGIDAYQILPELDRLRATSESYTGKTGRLTVSANNVIHRHTIWAQFVDGSPRLLDSKPPP